METRMLIEELKKIPAPGLGCAAFGVIHWGYQDDRDSLSALMTALDAGVRHIDTAAAYGSGHSETVIGKLIRRRPSIRDGLVLASKGGIKGSKKNFLKEIDNSRRRLGCEVVDIYYIHWPMEGVDPRPSLEALAEAREKRIIRYAGVSNFSPRQLQSAHSFIPLDACQFPYNLIWRNPETGLIPLCGELGIARVAYAALAQGFLTGKYRPGSRFPHGDHRDRTAFFAEENARALGKGLKKLKFLCDAYATELPVAALQWIVSREYIESGLVGARTASQAKENFILPAADPALLREIDNEGKEIAVCFGNADTFFTFP
ncbi:aldo/keto reductase [Marispirochaeta aestuarii]|uniref:aldo/keto reductase n=1 Tax=Marispirochaeta aestuarii TaxID=1963862 RepID=UPI002ABE3A36|nr:aldo/keto reductase [Marispirochaeta aestuarii]